jgi:hypothetical protein
MINGAARREPFEDIRVHGWLKGDSQRARFKRPPGQFIRASAYTQ